MMVKQFVSGISLEASQRASLSMQIKSRPTWSLYWMRFFKKLQRKENELIYTVKPALTTTSIRRPPVWDDQLQARPSKFLYNCYCIRRPPV